MAPHMKTEFAPQGVVKGQLVGQIHMLGMRITVRHEVFAGANSVNS